MQALEPLGILVEHSGAVGEVIADDQIEVSVAVQVGRGRRRGVPAVAALDQFLRFEFGGRGRGLGVGRRPAQINDRATAPVDDEHVHQAILIQVGDQGALRAHRRGVPVGERRSGVECECFVTRPCAGHGTANDLVGAWIDPNDVVLQPVAVQIAQRHAGPECGQVGSDVPHAGVDLADILVRRVVGHFGQRRPAEPEVVDDLF